jgi:hypothetical protein
MTQRSDMLNEISTALGGLTSSYAIQPSRDYDIFEGYIFALLLEEASNVRASVVCVDNSGNMPPPVCTFRTNPGHIKSDDQYTYALISFPGSRKPSLEAHVGIYVAGKSKVKHECDVALLFSSEAEACRQYHRSFSRVALPRYTQVLLSIECKYYDDEEIGIALARSFIGLVTDLRVKNAFFVTNKATSSPGKLLIDQGKRLSWQPRIFPNPFDDTDVSRLRGLFKDFFKNYLES